MKEIVGYKELELKWYSSVAYELSLNSYRLRSKPSSKFFLDTYQLSFLKFKIYY